MVDVRPSLIDFLNLFDICLDKCCLMLKCILVIVLSALLDVWTYVGHVALAAPSSNPKAGWRDGRRQLDTPRQAVGLPQGVLDLATGFLVGICRDPSPSATPPPLVSQGPFSTLFFDYFLTSFSDPIFIRFWS